MDLGGGNDALNSLRNFRLQKKKFVGSGGSSPATSWTGRWDRLGTQGVFQDWIGTRRSALISDLEIKKIIV